MSKTENYKYQKEISEIKVRSVEIIQYEQNGEKYLVKMNKIPKNYGVISITLIYVQVGSHEVGTESDRKKYCEKIMVKSSEICKENPLA